MFFSRIALPIGLLLSLFGLNQQNSRPIGAPSLHSTKGIPSALTQGLDSSMTSPKDSSSPSTTGYSSARTVEIRVTTIPGLQTMGTWNSQGLPAYLTSPTPDVIEPRFLNDIQLSLPEYQSVPRNRPEYLQSSAPTTLTVNELADVWITFIYEGAGWRNTLGFYTFDRANPPTSVSQIRNPTILFPNVSRSGSGGALLPGHKIKVGRFPAGTNIGFFLIADAFVNGQLTNGRYIHYSHEALNVEPEANLRRHVVVLDDSRSDRLLLAMEDIRRDSTGCDHDFNDAIFYMTSNPVRALDDPNNPKLRSNQPCPTVCLPVSITRQR